MKRPNLQNIPIKSELGQEIRKRFGSPVIITDGQIKCEVCGRKFQEWESRTRNDTVGWRHTRCDGRVYDTTQR